MIFFIKNKDWTSISPRSPQSWIFWPGGHDFKLRSNSYFLILRVKNLKMGQHKNNLGPKNILIPSTRLLLNPKGHLPPVRQSGAGLPANRALLISFNSKQACRKETLWLSNEKLAYPIYNLWPHYCFVVVLSGILSCLPTSFVSGWVLGLWSKFAASAINYILQIKFIA